MQLKRITVCSAFEIKLSPSKIREGGVAAI